MTSQNICKVAEYDDCIFYRTHCQCMNNDHAHTLELSFEDHGSGLKELNLIVYSDLSYYDFYDKKWYEKYWRRIKTAFSLLIGGHPQINDSFIFNGNKAVEDYIKALQEGLDKLKKIENK